MNRWRTPMTYATMNKADLRAACKAAGISYAKLTNDGMRAALTLREQWDAAEDQRLVDTYGFACCPACSVHLSNGVLQDGDETGEGKGRKIRLTHQFECMGCGHGFGPEVQRSERKPVANPGTGLKREANRPKQNGVTRPSAGGKCAAVWEALDAMVAAGVQPNSKLVRELADAKGWNVNNAQCELSAWRKFNGLSAKVQAAA